MSQSYYELRKKFIYFSSVYEGHLRGLLWAVLQDGMKHLHVVRISGIGQLIKDHKFNHSAQVISVCIQELPAIPTSTT